MSICRALMCLKAVPNRLASGMGLQEGSWQVMQGELAWKNDVLGNVSE